ncbi:hypothetical protein JQC91_02285 [Jannaschia sp. Os4]|uniref:hypothetical protein n=1 Tax=Jannaschia sp. Os4 TaxID=2807617 RepID=UPI001939B892|nr:hypothetical protein [Jannaschia sp. Os4]MBM2575122.1 hypothetical protein [Jannaschia sp. Os4]
MAPPAPVLSAPSTPRARARQVDLYSSDPLAVIGRSRGHLLCLGQLALQFAWADREEMRPPLMAELRRYVRSYVEHVRSVLHDAALAEALAAAEEERARILAFADELALLDAQDFAALDRARADGLARTTRERTLFDLYAVVMALQAADVARDRAHVAALSDRAALMDRLLEEAEGIGRALRMVGLAAQVEGAELSGAAGRVFAAMGAEVAALAARTGAATARARGIAVVDPGAADGAAPDPEA